MIQLFLFYWQYFKHHGEIWPDFFNILILWTLESLLDMSASCTFSRNVYFMWHTTVKLVNNTPMWWLLFLFIFNPSWMFSCFLFISNLNFFLQSLIDIVNINELTLILKIISRFDVTYINNNVSFERLYIHYHRYHIASYIWLAVILVIMSVVAFKTAIILYIYNNYMYIVIKKIVISISISIKILIVFTWNENHLLTFKGK